MKQLSLSLCLSRLHWFVPKIFPPSSRQSRIHLNCLECSVDMNPPLAKRLTDRMTFRKPILKARLMLCVRDSNYKTCASLGARSLCLELIHNSSSRPDIIRANAEWISQMYLNSRPQPCFGICRLLCQPSSPQKCDCFKRTFSWARIYTVLTCVR
jgi:hypothetical protein